MCIRDSGDPESIVEEVVNELNEFLPRLQVEKEAGPREMPVIPSIDGLGLEGLLHPFGQSQERLCGDPAPECDRNNRPHDLVEDRVLRGTVERLDAPTAMLPAFLLNRLGQTVLLQLAEMLRNGTDLSLIHISEPTRP